MIESMTFQKDWRCFKKGDSFEFSSGLNVLVGDQGTGKSSLIREIREQANGKKEDIAIVKTDAKTEVRSFDFEKDNLRTKGSLSKNRDIFGGQIASIFSSHGESVFLVLKGVEEFNTNKYPVTVLMDEPDMALSVRSIKKLFDILNTLKEKGIQAIITCHNPFLIHLAGTVYSMESRKTITANEFFASHGFSFEIR